MTPLRHLLRNSVGLVLVPTTVLGVAIATPSTTPAASAASADSTDSAPRLAARANGITHESTAAPSARAGCPSTTGAFAPRAASVSGVISNARVLALGQNRYGVPKAPPLTRTGRWQFAWDRDSGIRPGGRTGVVRLNAHTYPWSGAHGSALGNRLLRGLYRGDWIVLTGAGNKRVCYQVTKRFSVRAGGNFASYYSNSGPSRLAILVCSGKRRGPGNWSHRTIWFATPVR